MTHKFQDDQSIEEYNEKMLDYRHDSMEDPLLPGITFFLTLQPLSLPADPHQVRNIPAVPFGKESRFQLVKPLQSGEDFNSEVWLAKTPDSDVHVVFKFIIPSALPLPTPDSVRFLEWFYPDDIVDCQVRAYTELVELQGVIMPWDEDVDLLILEYIPQSFKEWRWKVAFDEGECKFRDPETFYQLASTPSHTDSNTESQTDPLMYLV
ncbi:hypothetical protein VNI00_006082 [Paramarasmius palmivorus]|uniref:Uncharacterized protein n=1 Tax=Paramarasmius palmivorus TaxID=297713 RepID=A0AAW0D8Z0_9AGAR